MPESTPLISHEELRARLRDPALTIVDVLPADSYAAGHIPGAINLPLAELPQRVAGALPDRSVEIAAYCAAFT
jgi:rhodanese-related sulfurtransferase